MSFTYKFQTWNSVYKILIAKYHIACKITWKLDKIWIKFIVLFLNRYTISFHCHLSITSSFWSSWPIIMCQTDSEHSWWTMNMKDLKVVGSWTKRKHLSLTTLMKMVWFICYTRLSMLSLYNVKGNIFLTPITKKPTYKNNAF